MQLSVQPKQDWFNRIGVQYFLVLLCSLALYTATCAPTVLWQDSGLFVYRIWHNDLQGNLGIALAHPLYIMLGIVAKLIPFGEPAWRINMISVVFGAIAVANLFLLLRLWLDRVWPALIGAVTLAVSWTFWQNAVLAEVYTLYAAQLFTELLVLFQFCRTKRIGYLYLLGFLNGLAIANHLWGIFPLACYGVFLLVLICRRQAVIRALLYFVIFWIIGALPYWYLIARDIYINEDFVGTINSALFGNGWQGSVLSTKISAKIFFENVIFILLNFPTPNLLLLFVGVAVLYRKAPCRAFTNIVLALAILYFVFAFRYKVPDRHAFFFPFYCLAALFIGLGADWFVTKFQSIRPAVMVMIFALLPVGSYFVTPEIARKHYPTLAERRQRPYRDEYTYWLQPWKTGYDGAERFATEALESVEEDAIVYAYTTDVHAMLYVQEVKGIRPDVKIVSNHDHSKDAPVLDAVSLPELLSQRSLYVTSTTKGYYPSFLGEGYKFVEQGLLYRVVEPDTDL